MTGYGDERHHRLADEAGFNFFLVKPVEPAVLEEMLEAVSGYRDTPPPLGGP